MTRPAVWHAFVPETSVRIACEGSAHTARWSAGDLRLDDHPDIDAERTLVALGGSTPPCLAAHDLWRDAVDDGGFLLEWAVRDELDTARRAWLRTALERLHNEGVQEFLHGLPIRRAERQGRVLAELPPALVDRAAMHVARRAADGGDVDPLVEAALTEAVRRRLRRAFVTSGSGPGRGARTAALVPFRSSVRHGVTPAVDGRLAGRTSAVEVTVAPRWLADVWAIGAANIDGRLVVGAVLDGPTLRATTVEWTGHPGDLRPRLVDCTAAFTAGRWRVGGDGTGRPETVTD